jgi:DNA-binding XRE family transcriptional regulator
MIDIDPIDINSLSKLIKWHRKRCKISQQTLAEISNVGRSSVQRIEKNQSFEFTTLLKVLDALNLKLHIDGPLIDVYKEENQ